MKCYYTVYLFICLYVFSLFSNESHSKYNCGDVKEKLTKKLILDVMIIERNNQIIEAKTQLIFSTEKLIFNNN